MPHNFHIPYPKLFCALLGSIVLLILVWWALPNFVQDPMPTICRQTPVRQYLDASDTPFFLERTWDYQWRMPVPLEQISPYFIESILAAEDHNFYFHSGVSYAAITRAFCFNLLQIGHRSGASTITMQLASLPREGRKKTYRDKFIQILQARKLEKIYSKERILYEYVNRVPFGGKIYGIEAAAWHYFDKSAKDLSRHEAILLAGLPRRPNGYNPFRHLNAAKERQQMMIFCLQRQKIISHQEANELRAKPLYFRDHYYPSAMEEKYNVDYFHYIQQAKKELGPNPEFAIPLCLNLEYQQILENVLRQTVSQVSKVKDGAAVLMDSKTSQVLAMVGTLDFWAQNDGEINAAIRSRSAGSTLKPFIYAEALDGGLITPLSRLQDTPLRIDNYVPQNYDGTFHGEVTATYALSNSLNIPAIRLLQALHVSRMKERLASLDLGKPIQYSDDIYGLTLALGTEGYTLLQLTNAYACLANQGTFTPFSLTRNNHPASKKIFTPGTAQMLSWMLRQRPLPQCQHPVAWKTGTSNGLCDAWCIAYTPQFTLGVWFGNKTGKPAAALKGVSIAAPAAGQILELLHQHYPVKWPDMEEYLEYKPLCNKSGLRPSDKCKTTYGWVNKAFATPQCTQCLHPAQPKLQITSPKRKLYLCPDQYGVSLLLQSNSNHTEWYIDNRFIGEISPGKAIRFAPGPHTLHAISTEGSGGHATFSFNVQQMQ